VSVTQCAGTNATFTVTASGTAIAYQWRKNGTNIAGATSASYTINNISASDAAGYTVVITGTCGTLTSAIATLTVNPATAITAQPISLNQCAGTNATFSVTATGVSLTYQWRKNGVNISGATNASITLNNIVAGDAGSYTVVVSGTCGVATSTAATLTINPATAISVQPVNATLCAGANANFSVTAAGTALTYQWRKNGTAIAGATNSSYSIPGVTAGDAASYDVVVTGNCGIVTSNAATLTVNPVTVITLQPVAVTQCAGTNATFTVTATGTSLTYQWRKNGTAIGGATNASITLNNITGSDAAGYDVVITGSCGTITSSSATLTVNTAPVISAQPADRTLCAGTSATFSVTATGTGLTYQWRKNGFNISGATGSSYTLNNIVSGDAGSYSVVITGTCGTATSNAATLTVAAVPQITAQPVGTDVCEGADLNLGVTATGTGITYQWRRNGSQLAGQTTATLVLNAVTPAQAGNYDVLVYGLCDTLTSDPATVNINPATAVTFADDDTLVCEGSTVDFNIVANGFGSNNYQWQWKYLGNWIDLADGGDISGVGTPDLQVKNAEAADTGYYRCVVTSGCGSAVSDSMYLNVNVIVATIGTPAPFLIDSTSTVIRVGVKVTDRFLNWDLGFSLVAPDGTEVILKAPLTFPCVFNPFNDGVDATFTNEIDRSTGDTIDYCDNIKVITGTFAASGNWNVLHGMDPANGAWQVRIYDADKSVPDPDGYIKLATLSFTDLDIDGDTAVINYNSGLINEGIVNPISGELRPTSFVVPIRLMTSCFNTQDARAVVTVKGGVAPYTYQWSGPTVEPSQAQVDLGAGTYSVIVTDALGCSSVATVDVSAPPAIAFTDVKVADTLACFESTNGYIRALANGGYGTLAYTLQPGNVPTAVADSAVFLNLGGGAYTLHVVDINGCSLDSVRTIATRPELQVQVTVVPVIGLAKGSITLTASGGTPPYRYSIDNNMTLVDTNKFDNLSTGVYPIYVEDANGCTFTRNVSLAVNALAVNVVKHDISCFGAADGDFFLTTTDGAGPYTLTGSWLSEAYITVDGLIAFTGQTAGSYDIQLVDSDGKMFLDTIEIVEPAEITATGVITDATCSALSEDGAISLTVGGGSGTYSFAWTGGATTQDLTDVEAGHYQVVITDDNDCSANFSFDIAGLNVATADAGSDATVCPAAEYQLLGNTGDSVHWEPAALTDNPAISNPWVSIMTSTEFILTVYQNGCADRDTVLLTALERIGMDIYDPTGETEIDTALFLLEGESHAMAATPGFTSYRWEPSTWLSDSTTEAVTTTPLDNIYYTVYGTTADGCVETDRVHVVIARVIEVYTGFSPNGDGINDTWTIRHAAEYGERIRVKVFNRWGEPVFESKGYGGSNQWDGTRNGKPLPVGAYYFIIDVDDGQSKPYTGTITILR
jgi:gliding motility-associated-like protein